MPDGCGVHEENIIEEQSVPVHNLVLGVLKPSGCVLDMKGRDLHVSGDLDGVDEFRTFHQRIPPAPPWHILIEGGTCMVFRNSCVTVA